MIARFTNGKLRGESPSESGSTDARSPIPAARASASSLSRYANLRGGATGAEFPHAVGAVADSPGRGTADIAVLNVRQEVVRDGNHARRGPAAGHDAAGAAAVG